MRWTQTLIPTLREDPADAVIASHRLLIRAGFIRQLTAGVYDFLPLGYRSLKKAMAIVREEMERAGASEVFLPVLNPIELWQKTGRDDQYGPDMFRLKDRTGRVSCLTPTHEETITEMVAAYISSWKQLPFTLYQIQAKFRDEPRPRFGLLRVREFLMKDAYSFDADEAGLDKSYRAMYAAYEKIFARCDLPFVAVEAESGPIGGNASHEFAIPCDAGEDVIVISDKNNYAANVEKAEIGDRTSDVTTAPAGELKRHHTPNMPGIEGVAEFLKVEPKSLLKTMVFDVLSGGAKTSEARPGTLLAIVRGDHDVNTAKLAMHARQLGLIAGDAKLALADEKIARANGYAIGYVGPHIARLKPDAALLIDPDATGRAEYAAGANEPDHHVTGFNWSRDVGPDILSDPKRSGIADIRNAAAGDPSPKNDGGVLQARTAIELGHVFKLGSRYSVPLGATFLDKDQKKQPILMGCYGIGVARMLIAAVETHYDDKGIIWPAALAPFEVVITPIKYAGEVAEACDKLVADLKSAGVDVLLDDRDARPGAKFADADLIGFPVRVTLGDRGLKEGQAEVKARTAADAENIPLAEVVARVQSMLA